MASETKFLTVTDKVLLERLEKAKAAAEAKSPDDPGRWWAGVLDIEWSNPREGNNATQWISIKATMEDGSSGALQIRSFDMHCGPLKPKNEDAAFAAKLGSKWKDAAEPRGSKKPTISVVKYPGLKVSKDGFTVEGDLPPKEKCSAYFRVIETVNEIFQKETHDRLTLGKAYEDLVLSQIRKKTSADKIVEAARKELPEAFIPGNAIISGDFISNLRKLVSSDSDMKLLSGKFIVAVLPRVVDMIQTHVSDKTPDASKRGKRLPNPITRISIPVANGAVSCQLKNGDKPPVVDPSNGKKNFEILKVEYKSADGAKVEYKLVDDDNIHLAFGLKSKLDLIIKISICISSLGISIPPTLNFAVVKSAAHKQVGEDDLYGPDDAVVAAVAAAAAATAGDPPSQEELASIVENLH